MSELSSETLKAMDSILISVSFSIIFTPPIVHLKDTVSIRTQFRDPESYGFDTNIGIVSDYFYTSNCAFKRHRECQNSVQKS